jgi:flavin reductase (DIM6/NTAB) family NADH-FMN oxidoreductase RutF
MEKIKNNTPCFFTQQVFIIGTYNEDKGENFAPISWISYTYGEPSCLVISIGGNKKTKENIARTGLLSATIVTPDMLPLVEQFNRATYKQELKDRLEYSIKNGKVLEVPLLDGAKFSYECQVIKTVEIGTTHTYFAEIKNVNASNEVQQLDFLDLRKINPVIYSPMNYFTVGEHLGQIGDFSK